ncbi:MAG: serine/threonine protein kinase [Myxococcales bacterium]|nr:serine/threonine protein kinase [Myxococcales bacterium]
MGERDEPAYAATEATAPGGPPSPALEATLAADGGGGAAPAAAVADGERYQLGGSIGAGGMGEVLSASDRRIGRDVAIKRTRTVPSPELAARFLREAQIQGRLDHPAIVPVYDLGVDDDGRPYFVMKRLAGTSLEAVLAAGPARGDGPHAAWSRRRLLAALVEVCLAIEFAHTRGVVHRDLKPANIMLGDFGEVYVLDWGVARVARDDGDERGGAEIVSLDGTGAGPTGTHAGAVLGTPGFMAPKQARGEPVSPRTDVYALGATLFEVLAGQPFARGRLDASDVDPAPSRRGAEVPPELDAICARALAPAPDDRFGSARALADEIQGYLDGDRDLERRRELARDHLAAARAALARPEASDARALAMRGAGQALALDPASAEAAALVSRLMLEPPAVTPPEVVAELHAADLVVVRRAARRSMWNFLALCSMIPVALYQGIHQPMAAVVFVTIAGAAAVNAYRVGHGSVAISRRRLYASFAINMLLVALLARAFGPFLVVPTVAAAALVSFAGLPLADRPALLATVASTAVVGPWLLELTGVTARSISFHEGHLIVRSASFAMQEVPMTVILVVHAVVVMFVAAYAAHGPSANGRAARDRLAIQAWQLRQMVSDPPSPSPDRDTNEA